MATLNIRNVSDETYRKVRAGAFGRGLTLAEWVEAAAEAMTGSRDIPEKEITKAEAESVEAEEGVKEEVVEQAEEPTKEEIRDSLRGLIRHMEGKGEPVSAPWHAKREICRYYEYDEQTGEHYRCGLEGGHRGKHTKGAKMEGEPRGKGCVKHGDKWCVECG